ncbi:MAG: hypothetical protein QM704_13655 [Anaeromyxobacteraceae bacterium]
METLVLAGLLVVAALVAYVAFAVSRRPAGSSPPRPRPSSRRR